MSQKNKKSKRPTQKVAVTADDAPQTTESRIKTLFRDPIFAVFTVVAALTALYDLAFAIVAAIFFGSSSVGFLPENFMPPAITAVALNAVTLIFAVIYPKIRLK